MLNFQLILRHNRMLLTVILNKLALLLTSYLTPVELIASSHLWRLRVRMVSQSAHISFSLAQPSIRRFCKVFFSKEIYKVPQMISRIAQCVQFLTKSFYYAFLPQPISNGYFLCSCRYGGFEGIPASHILLSQKPDPKEKQVINLDQDVQVCGYFWWMVYGLLCMNHLSLFLFFFWMGAIFSLSLSLTCQSMWHTFFGYASFYFLIAPYPCHIF